MRVIICGAGQVGYGIASYLTRENNDITLIDNSAPALKKASDTLDVKTVMGHASNPDVLSSAGAENADMVIAVTHADEVNMVACQVAHSLFNVPRKIARLRQRAYLDPAWANLFSRAHMPIDVIISPEYEVAKTVMERLALPGSTNVIRLAKGQLTLIGVMIEPSCPLVHTPLAQLSTLFPDAPIRIMAIFRNARIIIPKKFEQMLPGDEVYFIIESSHIRRALDAFCAGEVPNRHVVILGGGNIGLSLIREVQAHHPEISLKVIEQQRERAVQLSEQLENVTVFHGNCLEREILEEAGIRETETIVAITNDDETNILASLLARQQGCRRAITLVNKASYSSLFGQLGLGAVLSPKSVTVSTIMQHVRRGRIKAVHNIGDGAVEVIEAEASESCGIINIPIRDLGLSDTILIGAIIHNGAVIIPRPESIIRPGDRVIFSTTQDSAKKIEKLFSAQVTLV